MTYSTARKIERFAKNFKMVVSAVLYVLNVAFWLGVIWFLLYGYLLVSHKYFYENI